MISKTCLICGKKFLRFPSQAKRDFCSPKCWYSTIKGKGNPWWRPPVKRHCKECKKIFYVKRYEINIRPCAFCSMQCRAQNLEWRKRLGKVKRESGCHIKEKNGAWKGGISYEPYSSDFNKKKKLLILTRDNYTCQHCGKYGNYIHHIDYNKKNSSIDNLITTCNSCNTKANFGREKWMLYFQDKVKTLSNKMH